MNLGECGSAGRLGSDEPGDLPRVAMVSTHGYVAVVPPLGAAATGGQVVYALELSKKRAQLVYEVDIWTRQFESQPETERVQDGVRILHPRLAERLSSYRAETARSDFTWTGIAQQLIGATEQRAAGVLLSEFEPTSCWLAPKAANYG